MKCEARGGGGISYGRSWGHMFAMDLLKITMNTLWFSA